jgi:tRNA (guanine37-N1)-methyltransferase
MELDIFTLFPEAFAWFQRQRHVMTAASRGHRLGFVNYRDHTPLNAGQVDDTPFGGGAGMVLRVDVVEAALRARYGGDPVQLGRQRCVVALTPAGRLFDDRLATELSREPAVTLLSGRYEGFDQRVLDHFASDEVSIGRYVLTGGELPAMVVADAILRKLPGVLGHEDSAIEESFSEALGGAPEYPHYTRPAEYRGWRVPDVLLSGHHAQIRTWRSEQSRIRDQALGGERASAGGDVRYHGQSRKGPAV